MRSFKAAARIAGLVLLSLAGLAGRAHPALATDLITGQVVSGSVANAGTDTYTFTTANEYFFVFIKESGTHSTTSNAAFRLTYPGGSHSNWISDSTYWNNLVTHNVSGSITITVENFQGSGTAAGYNLEVVKYAGPAGQPYGGGALTPSLVASGSTGIGTADLYTFQGVAAGTGKPFRIDLTKSTGGAGYCPFAEIITPSGGAQGLTACTTNNWGAANTAAGTYYILVMNYTTGNGTGTYTVEASGTGVALPYNAKGDGVSRIGITDPVSHGPTISLIGPPRKIANGGHEGSDPHSGVVGSTGGTVAGGQIDIATGNLFKSVSDYSTVGPNPLALVRYYNSMTYTRNTYATLAGQNWRTNYDRYIRNVTTTQATAERPDGQVVNFTLVASVWTPDTDTDYKLTKVSTTWTLTTPDDVVETYTEAGGKGTLNSIAWPNGYTQTMNYTTGVLTSVSDSYSRTLSFTYTTGVITGVTTPDSATLTYGYTTTSGVQLLTSITYNTSPSSSQTYVYSNTNYPFLLTSITDENGNTNSQWTYEGAGRCTVAEDAGGANEWQVAYDDSTGNRTVTGPLSEADTYKFTTSQNISKVNEIDRAAASPVASATRTFTYDANGYLATALDWDGNSTHFTNNNAGQITSVTEAYGVGLARTTTITYDSTWKHKPYTTTKTNVTIDDRYDSTQGTLLTHTLTDTTGGATNGNTEIWTFTYNATGEMLTAKRPRTGTTVKNTYTWSSGALASITDQLSHTWTVNTANGTGQPTQLTDPNSVVTNLVYNNRNWLTSKTVVASPSNEVTSYTYIKSGQPDVITLPDSSTIDYDYDTAQRVTKITNTAGETANFTLNAMGESTATTVKDSGGTARNSFTATYDVLGDMLTSVGAGGAGQTTTFAYDANGNRTSTTDANSKQWQQAWDALNRPSTVTDPLTHTAAPTYNNLDQFTAQTDFLGYSTSYTRDAFGNAIARSSPDSGSWSFTYDEDNNVTGVTDARSTASTNTYDAVDRLTAVSVTGYAGEAEAFTYDDTTAGNKGVGRLTSWSDESGSGSRIYDNFGNITSETRVIGGKTYTPTYSYDLANRLTEIIYPSGRYVDYTYDSSGYLTTVTTKPSAGGGVTTLASSIVHKPFGPIASFTYGNSEALTNTYDNNYWLTALNTVYTGTYVQELSYGQDNAGNLTSITDTLDSTRNETFTVDDLNRLHTASGKYGSRTYTYDNNSNRATEVVGATTYTYTNVSSKNRLDHYTDGVSTRNFTYTANGNMATDDRTFIGGGSVSNTFGGRDRLESQTVNGNAVTFKINAFGQRISKAFSGNTTHFIHDIGGNIIAEANGSTGTTTQEYVWMEGQLLAQIDGSGNIVYVHNSYIGAPQKITNPSRTVVWDQIIEPFGEVNATPTNTTPTNHRFPGQYADAENSLSYNNFRDYDTSIGRYAEADPLGFGGGPNLYGYTGQNPLQGIDPWGLQCQGSKGAATTCPPAPGSGVKPGNSGGGGVTQTAGNSGSTNQSGCPSNAPDCIEESYFVDFLMGFVGAEAGGETAAADSEAYALARGARAKTELEDLEGASSKLIDVTKKGANETNIATNPTAQQMMQTLESNGYTRSVSSDGRSILYTKGDIEYSFYGERGSLPGQSGVQLKVNGKVTTKYTPGQ